MWEREVCCAIHLDRIRVQSCDTGLGVRDRGGRLCLGGVEDGQNWWWGSSLLRL